MQLPQYLTNPDADPIGKKHSNLYLIIVVGLMLAAGDVLWWQSQLLIEESDFESASIGAAYQRGDVREINRLDKELESLGTEMEQGVDRLETEAEAE